MPAIATVGCMFILLTCHRLGGGGGETKGRREKEEKKLNVCVQTVTCKDTVPYNLKCLHLSKTFQAAC